MKVEPLEDVAHRIGEAFDVAVEVLADVVLIAQQLLQVERGDVVEALPELPEQEGVGVDAKTQAGVVLRQHLRLGGASTQSSRRSTVNGRMTLP